MHHRNLFFSFLLLVASCKEHQVASPPPLPEEIAAESARLNLFLDSVYDQEVARDPERATFLGIKTNYDSWTDRSDARATRENEILKKELDQLRNSFDFGKLDDAAKISFRLFEYQAQDAIKNFRWRFHNYPVNQMDGLQQAIPSFLINYHRIDSLPDATAYIGRLRKISDVINQLLEGLNHRDSIGIILPRFVFPMVISDCRNVITGQPFDNGKNRSPLYDDFISKVNALKALSPAARQELVDHAKDALLEEVLPSYEKLIQYLSYQEQKATDDDGCWKFPDGQNFYGSALRSTTTTDLSADEIYETGVQEVKRIHEEMHEIMRKVNFRNDNIHDFFEFMRTDKRFYFPNTDEGKKKYQNLATSIIDTMRTRLDSLFHTKPKAGIVVKPVEPFREKSTGGAFYEDPSEDGTRPGTYYINLYNMNDQPVYQAQSLAYHEGIPGHHMQIAIAMELKNCPKFRKHGGNVAYVEGWALYAEQIPKEIGLYTDPYSDFGRLANEVFRAARLVVDVGIHYKKWTRKMAYDYFIKNTPNPEGDCRKEIDRYIVWPSQATGYKIGMMRIQQLRELAQKELKEKFDLRLFHDVILTNGPLPMKMLAENVKAWIAAQKSLK